jgi:hypothetical protein
MPTATETPVYYKTKKGRFAAFSSMSDLPLALKTLLQFIDGKTPLEKLKKRLGDKACSPELLAQLRERALINSAYDTPSLEDCKEQMADFVLANLPEDAIRILMEIQDINSMEMLKTTLGGYTHLVQATGSVGALHLLDLRLMFEMMDAGEVAA